MRVCLFTDTLADVNGVSRFIRNVAAQAASRGLALTVFTSTRLPMEPATNIVNFPPLWARAMPGYPELELAVPPWRAMAQAAAALRPDAVHVSTPGPVGMVGVRAAARLGVPLLGVYHTDFPAYVDHLFEDEFLTGITSRAMRAVYRRFATIFTRSEEYAGALERLGIDRSRVVRLRPGIDVTKFQPSMRDEAVWRRIGVGCEGPVVLYVGRVSLEKNLSLLVRAWRGVVTAERRRDEETMRSESREQPAALISSSLASSSLPRLVVIGDGPYRATMTRELKGCRAWFPGFVHGGDLSAAYASADLFVFPSATDTLGQVVMEAQSAGLPVLVSDQGGPREVVGDGETGMVLPATDAGAWSRAIAALIGDPVRRRAMGDAAHRAMQGMTIARSFEHFWEVHEAATRAKTP